MKNLPQFGRDALRASVIFLFAAFLCAQTAFAQTQISAQVTVTNLPVGTNTFVINGNTLVWTNTVSTPATQLLLQNQTTNAAGELDTNLVQVAPLPGFTVIWDGATNNGLGTNLYFLANVNQALTVSQSGNWCSITLTTNNLQNLRAALWPLSLSTNSNLQTNQATQLAADESAYSQTALHQTNVLMSEVVGLTNTQTISGQKTYSATNSVYNGVVSNAVVYGQTNLSTATFNGGWTNTSASTGMSAAGILTAITPQFLSSTMMDYFPANGTAGITSFAPQSGSLTFTNNAASGNGNVWLVFNLGRSSGAKVDFSAYYNANPIFDLELSASSAFLLDNITSTYSWLAGTNGSLTIPWLIASSGTASLTNSTLTNTTFGGTNTFAGTVAYTPTSVSTLANGNNSDIPTSSGSYIVLSGPTGSFTNCGFVAQPSGTLIHFEYDGGQNMSIGNLNGNESTSANRVQVGTGGTSFVTMTNNPAWFDLQYNGIAGYWTLRGHSN